MDWIKIQSEEDIQKLNNAYGYFEDSYLVKMEYLSGDSVDDNLVASETQENNLKVVFQRWPRNPFSIELWFEHTKRINMYFQNGNKYLSDIMFAKVCKNDKSYFWTIWEEFEPTNTEHLKINDVYLIEAESIKWRIVKD